MLCEGDDDAEGDILQAVRSVVGAIPISVSCDMHANITQRMIDACSSVGRRLGSSGAGRSYRSTRCGSLHAEKLERYRLPDGQFERIASDVMSDPQTYWNPRQTTAAEVATWLKSAW
jgi:hypothetical protein